MNSEVMLTVLNALYGKVVNGTGEVIKSASEIAEEYLRDNNKDQDAAIENLIKWHSAKAAAGGFFTNWGGLITLPVAIPANFASSLYIQLRMIVAIAHIRGYDVHEDKVQTWCYLCLAGNGAKEALKQSGIRVGTRMTTAAIQKYVSGAFLRAINKAVGFRLVTKAGTAGVVNLTKIVPVVGGIIGGSVDFYMTKKTGQFC